MHIEHERIRSIGCSLNVLRKSKWSLYWEIGTTKRYQSLLKEEKLLKKSLKAIESNKKWKNS